MEEGNSMAVQLRRARGGGRGWKNTDQDLEPIPATPLKSIVTAPRFKPPPGWGVEEVLRANGSHIDRYYYEPGTGRKFRSSAEVKRYLSGNDITRNHKSGLRLMSASSGKLLKAGNQVDRNRFAIVVSRSAKASPYFKLPDDWVVERIPRRFGRKGPIDKYYYEPGTGRRFRSLVAVERHLAELDGDYVPLSKALAEIKGSKHHIGDSSLSEAQFDEDDDVPLSKALAKIKENRPRSKVLDLNEQAEDSVPQLNVELDDQLEDSIPLTKNIHGDMKISSFVGLPKKVNWVLSSPHGDAWNPMISDMSVPDSVKQQWTERFMRLMNTVNKVMTP